MSRDLLKDAVLEWANNHWEELVQHIIEGPSKEADQINKLALQREQADHFERMQSVILAQSPERKLLE